MLAPAPATMLLLTTDAIGDPRAGVDLTGPENTIDVGLRAGGEQATIWTDDLSIAYVHENSASST
ncbi:hypothetical protein [Blastococcus sp. SYSU DS0973]